MAETTIYILKLEGGKYYIGKTGNVEKRFEAHLIGNGSYWTKKHRPIEIERTIPNTSSFDEDKYTKEYMALYGIDNVRGGSYVTMEISDEQREFLLREIRGAQDLCARCGEAGHFIRQCPLVDLSNNIPPTLTIPNPVFVMKNWFDTAFSKVHNEFMNPDSDMRSGRFLKRAL